MDAQTLTAQRYNDRNDKTEKLLGLSQTPTGLGVAEKYLEEYTTLVSQMLPLLKPLDIRKQVEVLDHRTVALVVISKAFDAIAEKESYLSAYYASAGKTLDFERFAHSMRTHDPEKADLLLKQATRGRGSLKARRAAARAFSKKHGLDIEMWPNSTRIKVGSWLHSVAISGPAFVNENGLPWLTDEAQSVVADVVRVTIETSPVRIPSKQPIPPWVGPEKTVEGYPLQFVRSPRKAGKRAVAAAFKDRSINPTVEAVNYIESVPYRVDQRIVDLVEWSFNEDLGFKTLKKFPQRTDYPMPDRPVPWEEMSPEQQQQWKKDASKAKRKNHGLKSQCNMMVFLLQNARWIGQDEFYLPCSLDFRGRVYAMSQFNFHAHKFVRAMFRFARGKALGSRGLYWLKVHCANSYGIDKVAFDERVAWVDEHVELIQATAADPLGDTS
jgi:DNA-directed RNA polymerase